MRSKREVSQVQRYATSALLHGQAKVASWEQCGLGCAHTWRSRRLVALLRTLCFQSSRRPALASHARPGALYSWLIQCTAVNVVKCASPSRHAGGCAFGAVTLPLLDQVWLLRTPSCEEEGWLEQLAFDLVGSVPVGGRKGQLSCSAWACRGR